MLLIHLKLVMHNEKEKATHAWLHWRSPKQEVAYDWSRVFDGLLPALSGVVRTIDLTVQR